MIRHLLKIIWNQRNGNGWIVLELFLVFVLLWYIIDFFTVLGITALTPNGFDIQNTYLVKMSVRQTDNPKYINYGEGSEEPANNFYRIVDRIRQHPDIEEVGFGLWAYPYCSANSSSEYYQDSLRLQCQILEVTPEYFNIFRIKPVGEDSSEKLVESFSNLSTISSDGKKRQAIITQTTENKLFPETQATGKVVLNKSDSLQIKILAVTKAMKPYDYTRPKAYILFPINKVELSKMNDRAIWDYYEIFFRTKSDFPEKEFAEKFKQEMKVSLSVGNFFLADIRPMSDVRDFYLKSQGIKSSIQYRMAFSVFFLANIFLAVIGTFWFRIEQRQSEIGLRIAVGSSRRNIRRIMFLESLLLLLIAAIPAILVCFNLIKFDLIPSEHLNLTFWRFLSNTIITGGLLIIVIMLGTWYPSLRASKLSPADALHYE